MKEFKGTKGEWKIENHGANGLLDKDNAYAIDSNNWAICAVWKDISTIESKANAQLIATAPELLKVLQYILDQKENEHCSTYMDEVCAYAEKVINKALGND